MDTKTEESYKCPNCGGRLQIVVYGRGHEVWKPTTGGYQVPNSCIDKPEKWEVECEEHTFHEIGLELRRAMLKDAGFEK